MAKPVYRLKALLIVRRRLKQKAEENLARAIIKLRNEKERLEKLENEKEKLEKEHDEAKRDLSRKMGSGAAKAGEGHVHINYLRRIEEDIEKKDEDIEEQKIQVEEAEEGLALARREYIDACKALKMMEKHKELWDKKIKHELSRKEAKELDDLGQTIHQLKKWRGEKPMFEV